MHKHFYMVVSSWRHVWSVCIMCTSVPLSFNSFLLYGRCSFAALWMFFFLLYGWFVVVWMVRCCLDGAANCCCKRSYSHNFQPWKKLTCSWTNFWICSGWLVTDTDHGDIGRRLGGLHSAPSYHILRPTSTAVKTLEVCQNGFHYHSTVVAMAKPNPRCKTRSDLFPAV